jgi:heme/copper-type cytochrome/quinol oxidase subunit 3
MAINLNLNQYKNRAHKRKLTIVYLISLELTIFGLLFKQYIMNHQFKEQQRELAFFACL